ncbi:RDD family protein 1 [Achromobacter spanius]|uniref:RDD family protein 1 n=1 Tax=Achromobacter spanius TaxID=217203 RepID=A0AAW3HWR2_9BURK|nr:RDD family protein 1 [Achromobacter spanius]
MQCPRCNWQNPASNTQCFSCQAPLPVPAAPASGKPKNKPSKAPASKAPAQSAHHNAQVFPNIWARLGASAIDAIVMAVGMIVLIMAAQLTYEGLTGNKPPFLIALAAGLIGWFLPAFMDAWGNGSPGKRVLKQRVVNRKGQAPGLLRSLWRHSLKYTVNLLLPGLFHHLQQMIFGERAMHNALAGTHVVTRDANPRAMHAAVARAPSVTGAGKFLFAVFGILALVVVGIVIGVNATGDSNSDNPLHADINRLDLVSDPVRRLAENHYRRTQKFPASLDDLGISAQSLESSGFSKVEMNPVNGVLRFTIAGTPSADGIPSLAGKHLVYVPELRAERKGGGVRRWQCGSDDILASDRTYSCRHDASAFAR